jgi:hypothetical protein
VELYIWYTKSVSRSGTEAGNDKTMGSDLCFCLQIIYLMKVIYEMRWAGHVERMSEERGVYRFLLGKPE